MNMLTLKSSIIFAIGYDLEARKARVTFCDKAGSPTSTYDYEHVSPEQVCELLFADSVGSYFQRVFKVVHTQYRKLTTEDLEAEKVPA